jgi:hypothetical protein
MESVGVIVNGFVVKMVAGRVHRDCTRPLCTRVTVGRVPSLGTRSIAQPGMVDMVAR